MENQGFLWGETQEVENDPPWLFEAPEPINVDEEPIASARQDELNQFLVVVNPWGFYNFSKAKAESTQDEPLDWDDSVEIQIAIQNVHCWFEIMLRGGTLNCQRNNNAEYSLGARKVTNIYYLPDQRIIIVKITGVNFKQSLALTGMHLHRELSTLEMGSRGFLRHGRKVTEIYEYDFEACGDPSKLEGWEVVNLSETFEISPEFPVKNPYPYCKIRAAPDPQKELFYAKAMQDDEKRERVLKSVPRYKPDARPACTLQTHLGDDKCRPTVVYSNSSSGSQDDSRLPTRSHFSNKNAPTWSAPSNQSAGSGWGDL